MEVLALSVPGGGFALSVPGEGFGVECTRWRFWL
jgi:hypothetical protein